MYTRKECAELCKHCELSAVCLKNFVAPNGEWQIPCCITLRVLCSPDFVVVL